MLRILTAFSILLAITSCSDDDQKVYSKLEGLRVLAIAADAPEINGPQTVNLTPYLSYPDGGGANLSFTFEACLDPGISLGASPNCDSYPASEVITGSASFSTGTIGAAAAFTGPGPVIAVPIPASAFAFLSTIDANRQLNGVDMLVFIQIQDDSRPEVSLQTLKRITLTSKTKGLNQNPSITGGITSNGSALAAFPSGITEFALSGASPPESYLFRTTEGVETSIDEKMTVSWFSNVGTFQFTRTDPTKANEFDPESTTSGIFVGIYRDDRGGVTAIQLNF